MLNSILIQNIVLIERLEIKMEDGLCVLTGETGSGKSILLDALGLAIGSRSNSRLLRQGAKQGLVVAEFDIKNNLPCQKILEENGLTNPDNKNILILRRILLDNSTSKAFVNDISVGVNLLGQIGDSLLEVHGQFEQRGLLNPSYHKIILDEFSGLTSLVKSVNQAYDSWRHIVKQIDEINENKEKNEREKDYLNHIVKELKDADIQIDEEDELVEKRNLLQNKEKIINLLQELETRLNDADSNLNSGQKLLIRNHNLGNIFANNEENKLQKLSDIFDEIISKNDQAKDLLNEIHKSANHQDWGLEEIEERLFLIRNLSRKFNLPINNLPEFLEENINKLKVVENYQGVILDLEKQRKDFEKKYLELAKVLSKSRVEGGLKLSKIALKELSYLKMEAVKFDVKITELSEENYNRDGIDSVKFVAATNKNSALDDISKIASGGELSRFMLALKVALSDVKSVPILIFDEIDSGIGGAVADAVGERLRLLSKKLQIMVVTHHAQVAAKANYHLRVRKTNDEKITNTIIDVLNAKQREEEIARMLSGEKISNEAIAAAKSLIAG